MNAVTSPVDIDQYIDDLKAVDEGVALFAELSLLTPEEVERQIDSMEEEFLRSGCEDIKPPHENYFQPEVYIRRIFMPAGQLVIGARHKTEHFNIILTGKALVLMDGKPVVVQAPAVIKSVAGVRKCLYILEDMQWITVHTNPDNETVEEALQDRIAENPPHRVHAEARVQNLLRHLDARRYKVEIQ